MSYLDKVRQLLLKESKSSRQAKAMGLTYAGYSKWNDAQGNTVAKTVNGELVRIDPETDKIPVKGTKTPAMLKAQSVDNASFPSYRDMVATVRYSEPDKSHIKGEDKYDSLIARDIIGGTKLKGTVQYGATREEYNLEFRPRNWYQQGGYSKFAKTFRKAMNVVSDARSVMTMLGNVMKIAPYVEFMFDEQLEPYVLGSYNALEQLKLSPDTTTQLRSFTHLTEDHLEQFVKAARDNNYHGVPQYVHDAMQGVRTAIHEMVHAKDKVFDNLARNGDWNVMSAVRGTPILEGLTELKARQIFSELFIDRESTDPWKYSTSERYVTETSVSGYQRRVEGMELLDAHRPGVLNELWECSSIEGRISILNNEIESIIAPHLTKLEDSPHPEHREIANLFFTYMEKYQDAHDGLYETGFLTLMDRALKRASKKTTNLDQVLALFKKFINTENYGAAMMTVLHI